MADNKIIIGSEKEKDKSKPDPISTQKAATTQIPASDAAQVPVEEPIDENVWGNDHIVLNKLDEKMKADRRLYARAKYIQRIECVSVMDAGEMEQNILPSTIKFMVIDVSMGGIGIISDEVIEVGKVLVFDLKLDNTIYSVKYEVVYCFTNDGKYRAGLRIKEKDKIFIKHLKILVARLTLQSAYGNTSDKASDDL